KTRAAPRAEARGAAHKSYQTCLLIIGSDAESFRINTGCLTGRQRERAPDVNGELAGAVSHSRRPCGVENETRRNSDVRVVSVLDRAVSWLRERQLHGLQRCRFTKKGGCLIGS